MPKGKPFPISTAEFIERWEKAKNPRTLAKELGLPARLVSAKAQRLRDGGVGIRKFVGGHEKTAQQYRDEYGAIMDESLSVAAAYFGVDPKRALHRNDTLLHRMAVRLATHLAHAYAKVPLAAFYYGYGSEQDRANKHCREIRRMAQDPVFAARLDSLGATLMARTVAGKA